jgi:hypothetical protein
MALQPIYLMFSGVLGWMVLRACHDNRVSHGWTKIGAA